ncbi:MAG: glycosyl hydrolase, partial [Armatimonadota bacterium]
MSSCHTVFSWTVAGLLVAFSVFGTEPAVAQRGRGGQEEADTGRQRDPLERAVAGLRFRSIGPGVISGRISDIAVDPTHRSTWYVATASGGLWKTTNAGTSFSPIFDGEGSYSIGVVALDPKNSNVVWVGTGENNAQRSVSYGDGVYKSIDGGGTWKKMGLEQSEHIGKILVDPRNSDVVYVAAQGPVFSGGGDRGLYKTTDGGETWTKILDGGEWAGVSDVVMDPRDPDILIAAVWQRARRQWGYIAGGPESGLHRSTDGGETWVKSQRGLPSEELGRIGLAISPVDPDVVYAIVEAANGKGGFYRSRSSGVSWQRMSDRSTIGLYYQEIFADPQDVDRVYVMDTRTWITEDGGKSFEVLGERNKHVDNHALWIDPEDTDHLIIGCDGGLYESFDRGATYDWFQNLPLGQFYRVEVDSTRPFYRVFGGTQDNSSVGGPSRTRTRRGGRNADWFLTQGGDGFYSRIDPSDPNTIYAESQYAGLTRFNLATGERVSIRPEPAPGEPPLVWHW